MVLISVITPIYNAETYIERCIRSLFSKTFDKMEFIFVDDGSTDGSMKILQNFFNEYSQDKKIKILSNPSNLGVTESRKKGLLEAIGDYIGWVDADDWVESEAFEKMYNLAVQNNADIVVSNSIWHYEDHVKYMEYKHNVTPIEGLVKMFDHHYLPYQLWSHLIKKEIMVKSIESLYPTNYGEDFYMLVYAYYYSNNVVYLDDFVYNYENRNEGSIMHTMCFSYENWIQQKMNIQLISNLLYSKKGGYSIFHKAVNQVKFNRKNKFRASFPSLRVYYYTFEECYSDIVKKKDFKPYLSRFTKLFRFSFYLFYWIHYHKTDWRNSKSNI